MFARPGRPGTPLVFHDGQLRRLVPPEDAADHDYTAAEQRIIDGHAALWIVGSPQTVRAEILRKVEEAGADEVMVTTTAWSYEARLRSFRLLADAFGLGG